MTNTNQQPSEAEVKSVIALFSNGEYQQAIDEIAILSKNFPKSHMLHNIKGACYAGLGQLDSAVKSYEKAIIIKPDYAKAHFNLGGALHELNDYEQSLKSYRKTIEIDPDYAEAHNNLGNLLRELGRPVEALSCFQKSTMMKLNRIFNELIASPTPSWTPKIHGKQEV